VSFSDFWKFNGDKLFSELFEKDLGLVEEVVP